MRSKPQTDSFQADDEHPGRPCARGEWCSGASRTRLDDGTTERTPASGPRAFCDADEAIIGDALRAFPATWRRLWPHLLTQVTGEVSVRVPFGPSVPIRTDADAILRALVDCALSWHERVSAVDGELSPPGGRDGTQGWHRQALGRHAPVLLEKSARRLGQRVTVLVSLGPEPMMRPSLVAVLGCAAGREYGDCVLADADGASAGNEVLRLDYLARAAMGEIDPAPVRLIGVPCRECGRSALHLAQPKQYEADTQYYSVCSWCRDAMEEPDYRAWVRAWASYYEQRTTPAMLAAATA